jgi:cation:H+ antiporter
MAWITFLLSAIAVVIAGTKLSVYGDRIAEQSGLGRLWIGVIFLAGATSLPELFTSVSAVLIDEPNLAVGDLLGAGLSNMLTLALIDLIYRRKRLWQQVAFEQALIASLAIILTGLAGLLILVRYPLPLLHIGIGTIAIAVTYLLGMRVVFRQEDMHRRAGQLERVVLTDEVTLHQSSVKRSRKQIAWKFAIASMGILVAAPLLANSAKQIAAETGISTSFVGTSLVAIVTSLPELVVTFASVRLGAFDLGVGNLFGSNAFNMAILLITDIAYLKGPLLASVDTNHAVTALISILLMSVGVMGIIYRAERRFLLIEPDSVLMIVGYILGMGLMFSLSRQ